MPEVLQSIPKCHSQSSDVSPAIAVDMVVCQALSTSLKHSSAKEKAQSRSQIYLITPSESENMM